MAPFTIAGTPIELDPVQIERALVEVLPEPIQEHYVVVRGRRYPPKQVITCATGLDRADFTTHQARRILLRLGFTASRVTSEVSDETDPEVGLPHGGRQAAALAPHAGR